MERILKKENKIMDALKIVLMCPDCGCNVWVGDEFDGYKCVSCGSKYYTEQMCPETESIEIDF